jgi:hypothetical protein
MLRIKAKSIARLCLTISTILFFEIQGSPVVHADPTWTKIYETTTSYRNNNSSTSSMTYTSGFGKTGGAASAFIAAGTSWDFIKIRMEMTRVSNNTKYYAEVYFDKWSGASISDLQFPDYENNLNLKKNVTNIVVTSDYSGVKTGSYAQGRIEFWPYNYTTGNTGYAPFGNDSLYDWDDAPSICADCYGSYQVHNLTDTQTIMAWNNHGYGRLQDLGLGSQATNHPDWTFAGAAEWNNTNFKVQIFVGTAITASTINAPTVSGAALKSKSTTLTATASVAGKVTFYFGTKKIPGCSSRPTVDVGGVQTATCTFKPFTSGAMKYSAQLVPTSSSYTGSNSPVSVVQIGRRTGTR